MTWSSLDLAGHCRADARRTNAFEDAISRAVRPGDVVVDIGAGSGVLSLLSVRSGARRTIAVESDETICGFLSRAIEQSGCPIELVCSDALTAQLPPADVLVAELIDVWLLEEQFAQVLSALAARGVVGPGTRIVPSRYDFHIEFGVVEWGPRFAEIPWPHYEWPYYDADAWTRVAFSPLVVRRRVHSLSAPELMQEATHDVNLSLEVSPASSRCTHTSTATAGMRAARLAGLRPAVASSAEIRQISSAGLGA